ncbi:hypothetical protein BJP34_23055 [Moorena producens PAL-8-15-08-1]|uniref:Uncharacterized protein n=1 Tax=Moorena producens PAL-8-15-08-1 TaxID=1458985 RepID=A0A1D8TWJ2_9CYAN|nr:hypothetical protein [Moorena producens]AOX01925.1 hypothetical protein BJP34_23055 [Moorena producens PAL-8-15-08-1]
MLQSYEAIIENGQIQWLTDAPTVSKARVIVTILSDSEPNVLRRTPSAAIAGKGRTLEDLVTSVLEEEDWECLK